MRKKYKDPLLAIGIDKLKKNKYCIISINNINKIEDKEFFKEIVDSIYECISNNMDVYDLKPFQDWKEERITFAYNKDLMNPFWLEFIRQYLLLLIEVEPWTTFSIKETICINDQIYIIEKFMNYSL